MNDWRIFRAPTPDEKEGVKPHAGLARLPAAPPWRRTGSTDHPAKPARPSFDDFIAERIKGEPIRVKDDPKDKDNVVRAINAALYLRRPLLVTGKPGVGKSSLAYAVAYQLQMGPVLKWPITSRATVKSGLYEYDAVGRLQDVDKKDLGSYFRLGPLGTALYPTTWPRVLLIDEIDKGDVDLTGDLLNLFEDGYFEIPELTRLDAPSTRVRTADADGRVEIAHGRVGCRAFPFVVLTSNEERDFPPAFLRRCIRHYLQPPDDEQLAAIVAAHLGEQRAAGIRPHIDAFLRRRSQHDLAADQLLSLIYLAAFHADGAEPGEPMAETVLRPLTEG